MILAWPYKFSFSTWIVKGVPNIAALPINGTLLRRWQYLIFAVLEQDDNSDSTSTTDSDEWVFVDKRVRRAKKEWEGRLGPASYTHTRSPSFSLSILNHCY
jgi:hypothetical protein